MRFGRLLVLAMGPRSVAGWVAVLCLAGFYPCLAAEPVPVAVSVLPEKYLVERVGGPNVDVFVTVEPGQNPATYEPSTGQLDGVKRARVYFRLGVPFETWINRLLASNHHMRVVNVGDEIKQRTIEQPGGQEMVRAEQVRDSYVWLSPPLAKGMAARICDTLVGLDPAHKNDYERKYAQLAAELDALDIEIRSSLAPVKHRVFITAYPAWGYFADTYDLRQIPIASAVGEPDADSLQQVSNIAKREGIKVVYVEPQFSRASAEKVAQEIGARVVEIDPLAEDYVGNLRKIAAAFAEAQEAK